MRTSLAFIQHSQRGVCRPVIGSEGINRVSIVGEVPDSIVINRAEHVLFGHGRRINGFFKNLPKLPVQFVVSAGEFPALVIASAVHRSIYSHHAIVTDVMQANAHKEQAGFMGRQGDAVRPALKAFLCSIAVRNYSFGDIGVVGVRRRDVQDHSHSGVRLHIHWRAPENPVHNPGEFTAADKSGRICGIPVDPAPLNRKAEGRPGVIVRFQIGKGCGSFRRRIKAAQQPKQFRAGYLVVRIEPVSLQDAEILQCRGSLMAAVVFVHIQKHTFSHTVEIQQLVQHTDEFPYRDNLVYPDNPLVVGREIGGVLLGWKRQRVPRGVNGVLRGRYFNVGFRRAVRPLPIKEGVSFQFNRRMQGCTAAGGYLLDNISLIGDQIPQLE